MITGFFVQLHFFVHELAQTGLNQGLVISDDLAESFILSRQHNHLYNTSINLITVYRYQTPVLGPLKMIFIAQKYFFDNRHNWNHLDDAGLSPVFD